MEKILNDRLNHLKSKLQEESNPKLSKIVNEENIHDIKIRIMEVEWMIYMLNKLNSKMMTNLDFDGV